MNELLNLVNIVATPLVVFVLPILMFLYKYRHSDNKDISFIKYSCTFDATHGLARQPLFWVAIVYPIGLFFFTGLYAWAGTNFDISATGFNQFIEISKLPLGLLALSLPLAVLTARLHGTKQTAMQIQKTEQQIKEAQQKNKTDLYLAHYKHFCEHIDSILEIIELDYGEITILKKDLYRKLYPDSSLINGPGDISHNIYNITLKHIQGINVLISKVKYQNIDIEEFCSILSILTNRTIATLQQLSVSNFDKTIEHQLMTYNYFAEKTLFINYSSFSYIPRLINSITTLIYSYEAPLPEEMQNKLVYTRKEHEKTNRSRVQSLFKASSLITVEEEKNHSPF